MIIKSIEVNELCIPFKQSFKHNTATRHETATVWLRVESVCGIVAYGESCPRSYVTNETLSSAREFIRDNAEQLIAELHDLEDLRSWIESNAAHIDKNPAACCALELALLDLLAKEQESTVESLLSLPVIKGSFAYSAVLGDSQLKTFRAQLAQYVHLGIEDYKVKISGELAADVVKFDEFSVFKELAPKIRLDANNLWPQAADAIAYLKALPFPVWAIEEPLQIRDYKAMAQIAKSLGITIILDESFLRLSDLDEIRDDPDLWIINLRISKMGGLLRSLRIAEAARLAGIPIIIGAQVGETSLLTRAALTVANAERSNLLAQEGAFGTYLLETDVIEAPLMFTAAGLLHIAKRKFSQGYGFGISIKSVDAYLR